MANDCGSIFLSRLDAQPHTGELSRRFQRLRLRLKFMRDSSEQLSLSEFPHESIAA